MKSIIQKGIIPGRTQSQNKKFQTSRPCEVRRSGQVATPHNVGSVLWRLFSTLEVVQYIGGITSVLWGDSFSTVGDNFSTVEVVQYSGG